MGTEKLKALALASKTAASRPGIQEQAKDYFALVHACTPDAVLALIAEVERLRAEVSEWLCIDCNTVYPGPPQPGFACVVCPKCGGSTGPRLAMENRLLRAELTRDQSGAKTPESRMDAAFEGGPNCVACEDSPSGDNNPCAVCGRAAPAAGTEKDALCLAKEAIETAQRSHGVQLASYPPQDAWMVNRVDEKLRAALKAIDESNGHTKAWDDTKRLDFMLAEECQIEHMDRVGAAPLYRVRWPWREEHRREWSKSGREAIDAAIGAQAKAGKDQP